MRIQHLIIATALIAATSLQASETITQDTLDQTLLNAQNAVQDHNYSEAFELYSQAAQWGHKGAQYVLGVMYVEGKGVARNEIVGYAWLDVASESHDRAFVKARKATAKSLSEAELQKAEALAEKISAAYGMEAAGVSCRKEMRVGSNIKVVNCYHRNTTAGGDLIVPDYQGELLPAS